MAKRWALYFGAAGYLLVVWYNGFALRPLSNDSPVGQVLYHACPMCADSIGGAWNILLVRAPLNGLHYAVAGFLLGWFVSKLTHKRVAHP